MLKRLSLLLCICLPLVAAEPDAATRQWWSYTQALANDKMQRRDTGVLGTQQLRLIGSSARLVLTPAGTNGFQ